VEPDVGVGVRVMTVAVDEGVATEDDGDEADDEDEWDCVWDLLRARVAMSHADASLAFMTHLTQKRSERWTADCGDTSTVIFLTTLHLAHTRRRHMLHCVTAPPEVTADRIPFSMPLPLPALPPKLIDWVLQLSHRLSSLSPSLGRPARWCFCL